MSAFRTQKESTYPGHCRLRLSKRQRKRKKCQIKNAKKSTLLLKITFATIIFVSFFIQCTSLIGDKGWGKAQPALFVSRNLFSAAQEKARKHIWTSSVPNLLHCCQLWKRNPPVPPPALHISQQPLPEAPSQKLQPTLNSKHRLLAPGTELHTAGQKHPNMSSSISAKHLHVFSKKHCTLLSLLVLPLARINEIRKNEVLSH